MFDCLSPSSDAYEERLERLLGAADAVLCMVPSQEPLFPARYLIGDAKDKKRSVYVSAIGSWQPEMIELDPALLRYAVDGGGLIIVDDCEHVLEVGEIIQSGVGRNQMVELGELFDVRQLRRDAERLHRPESDVNAWLEDGMVIYKSAGVGLMDLAAGTAILALASERGLGVVVSDF
jgi:ornithine cyclodeaminase/alanine dehydrogenase-like protein (mu-crystallin family)